MKKFKKFLSVAMGCAMAFSTLALSACEGCNPTDPELQLNIEKTEPAVVAPKAVSEEVQTIINGLSGQNILSVKSDAELEGTVNTQSYYCNQAGVAMGEVLSSSNINLSAIMEAIVNVKTGEADTLASATLGMVDGGLTVSQSLYLYEYVRGLSSFSYYDTAKPEDISAQTLTYAGSVDEIINAYIQGDGDISGILGGGSLVNTYALASEEEQPEQNQALISVLTELLSPENMEVDPSSLIELAAMTGSLSASGDTVTIDVNSMIYALAMQFSVSFATIDSSTTISQILNKNVVEKYFKAFSDDISVQDIYSSVCSLAPEADLSLFAPEEGATAYEYLTSVLQNQNVATLVGVEEPLGDITLGEVVTLITGNEDSATLITAFKTAAMGMIPQIFTPTEIIIPADLTGGLLSLTVKELVYEIKLDINYNAISQSFGGYVDCEVKSVEDLGYGVYVGTEIGMEITFDSDSQYYSTAQTLTNISDFAAINALTGEQTTAGQIIANAPTAEETAASIVELIGILVLASQQPIE